MPYTIYTTGIGWRTDQVPADIGALKNPYESLWDPQYKDKTAIIDDWHTAMAMVLLKQGITDVNTSSADDLKMVGEQLSALVKATSPKVTITMYSDLPAGQIGLSQMWSGDIINAQSYLPEGTGVEILRYWFPADGKGLVDNDMLVTLKGGKNPVLAHLFLNHMLDPDVAKENFSAIGYQPPQNTITADSLVAEEFIPENLRSAIVKPEYFDTGYRTARTRSPPTMPRGTTCGTRSTPAGPDVRCCASSAPDRRLWAALAAPGIVWLLLFFLAPLYVVLCDRVRPGGPDLPHGGSGVESAAVGCRLSSTTCCPASSAPTASTVLRCCAPSSTSWWPASCAC